MFGGRDDGLGDDDLLLLLCGLVERPGLGHHSPEDGIAVVMIRGPAPPEQDVVPVRRQDAGRLLLGREVHGPLGGRFLVRAQFISEVRFGAVPGAGWH